MNNSWHSTIIISVLLLASFVKTDVLPLPLKVGMYILQALCVLLCGYRIGKAVGENKKKKVSK